jgi:hypothetical protein
MVSVKDRCSRTEMEGDGVVKKISSSIISCSGVALVRFLEAVCSLSIDCLRMGPTESSFGSKLGFPESVWSEGPSKLMSKLFMGGVGSNVVSIEKMFAKTGENQDCELAKKEARGFASLDPSQVKVGFIP